MIKTEGVTNPPQMAGEPDTAYKRFLLYYNSGVRRSINKAYRAHLVAKKGKKKEGRTPGSWSRDARDYDWRGRADRWDIVMMREQGTRTVVNYIKILNLLSEKTLKAMESELTDIKDTKTAISALSFLKENVSAEAIAVVAHSVSKDNELTKAASTATYSESVIEGESKLIEG